ncbi:monocarboxylate transporter 12 [Elysia marginata]|uniref:Monocarboxylate transporter 12 n=1 Tax=Elysia marginata TaxID=1093978 RepID=A0AAV4GDZ3_9GAST|nr:monocarboxylate transporter 12 [Elysia marginata]
MEQNSTQLQGNSFFHNHNQGNRLHPNHHYHRHHHHQQQYHPQRKEQDQHQRQDHRQHCLHHHNEQQQQQEQDRQQQHRPQHSAPSQIKYPALDGGWGYFVAVGAFCVAFMLDGTESCYGLLLPHVIKAFGGHVALASMCGGLVTGVILGTGPLAAFLVRKFGCRQVSFVGSIVASASVVMATLARRIEVFVLFYGLCAVQIFSTTTSHHSSNILYSHVSSQFLFSTTMSHHGSNILYNHVSSRFVFSTTISHHGSYVLQPCLITVLMFYNHVSSRFLFSTATSHHSSYSLQPCLITVQIFSTTMSHHASYSLQPCLITVLMFYNHV